jgi:hypothetical protein
MYSSQSKITPYNICWEKNVLLFYQSTDKTCHIPSTLTSQCHSVHLHSLLSVHLNSWCLHLPHTWCYHFQPLHHHSTNISSSGPSNALDIQHIWNPFRVTSGNVRCHVIIHYQQHVTLDFLFLPAWVKALLPLYEPLIYICFRWSLNGLFTTCNTQGVCSWNSWFLFLGQTVPQMHTTLTTPFPSKHLWLSVPSHCQPILYKFIHHLTFRLASDKDLFRLLLHRHTFAIYNHMWWYLLPSGNAANIMVTWISSLPVAFISRFCRTVIDSVIW